MTTSREGLTGENRSLFRMTSGTVDAGHAIDLPGLGWRRSHDSPACYSINQSGYIRDSPTPWTQRPPIDEGKADSSSDRNSVTPVVLPLPVQFCPTVALRFKDKPLKTHIAGNGVVFAGVHTFETDERHWQSHQTDTLVRPLSGGRAEKWLPSE